MLTRDMIKAATDSRIETVSVPEWGGDVCVRTMTGTERDALESWVAKHGNSGFRGRLACYCVCDEDGKRIFEDSDIGWIGSKSASALDRITDVALRLNRMTAESVEDAEKNSGSGQSV